MAQLDRTHNRHVATSKGSASPTMEQLIRGETSKGSITSSTSPSALSSSPFFQRLKEKAKKLRHSLTKKKHEDEHTTPSRGVGLQEEGREEEDAEYLGAPMYESEMAHEGYKENARQHPRAAPVINEKHVLPSTDKSEVEHDRESPSSRAKSKRPTKTETVTTSTFPGHPNQKTTRTATAITNTTTTTTSTLPGPNQTMTKTLADKLIPASAEDSESDAARSIASKIQGIAVSKPADHHQHHHHHISAPTLAANTTGTSRTSLSLAGPLTPPARMPTQTSPSTSIPRISSAPVTPQTSSSLSAPLMGKNNAGTTPQIWDKGFSVKEYLMNKLEPGEDERALSQVISEAMSPRRTPGDAGVMEKVREAVTSLLRTEEPSKCADTNSTTNPTRASSQISVSTNESSASPIPVSTNAHEVGQEENQGRILQAN